MPTPFEVGLPVPLSPPPGRAPCHTGDWLQSAVPVQPVRGDTSRFSIGSLVEAPVVPRLVGT